MCARRREEEEEGGKPGRGRQTRQTNGVHAWHVWMRQAKVIDSWQSLVRRLSIDYDPHVIVPSILLSFQQRAIKRRILNWVIINKEEKR